MKKCSFCAEEIQDAAIICRHCTRDVPAPARDYATLSGRDLLAVPKPKNRWLTAIVVVCLLGAGLVVVAGLLASAAARSLGTSEPLLQVSAAKGPLGIQITSREPRRISKCDLTLLDVDDAAWHALLPAPLQPSETIWVTWAQFTAQGQPMPASIGRGRRGVTMSCLVQIPTAPYGTPDTRRSAGLWFPASP